MEPASHDHIQDKEVQEKPQTPALETFDNKHTASPAKVYLIQHTIVSKDNPIKGCQILDK